MLVLVLLAVLWDLLYRASAGRKPLRDHVSIRTTNRDGAASRSVEMFFRVGSIPAKGTVMKDCVEVVMCSLSHAATVAALRRPYHALRGRTSAKVNWEMILGWDLSTVGPNADDHLTAETRTISAKRLAMFKNQHRDIAHSHQMLLRTVLVERPLCPFYFQNHELAARIRFLTAKKNAKSCFPVYIFVNKSVTRANVDHVSKGLR